MTDLNLEQFKLLVFDFENETQWKLLSKKPVVLYFYSNGCGNCVMIKPLVEMLEAEYDGSVDFYKINSDEEKEIINFFAITDYPTLLFIPLEGNMKMIGIASNSAYRKLIDEFLLSPSQN